MSEPKQAAVTLTADDLNELEYPTRLAKASGFKYVEVDVDHVLSLIAAARASLESKGDAADKFVALRAAWENTTESDMDPFTEFCRHFDWSIPTPSAAGAESMAGWVDGGDRDTALLLFEQSRPDTARRSRNEGNKGETTLRYSAGEVEEAFADGYVATRAPESLYGALAYLTAEVGQYQDPARAPSRIRRAKELLESALPFPPKVTP